jgi:outer membrane lipoprotein SlyB
MSDEQTPDQTSSMQPSEASTQSRATGDLDTVREIITGAITGSSAGAAVGAAIGGVTLGAAIGTSLFPVVGTIVGALIGGSLNAYLKKHAADIVNKTKSPAHVTPPKPESDVEEKAKKP